MKLIKRFLIIIVMNIFVVTGCDKGEKGNESLVENTPVITGVFEMTPTQVITPTPTVIPGDDGLIPLTPDETEIIHNMAIEYYPADETGIKNWVTCHIVAYYKYIGLDEFLLPVVADYTVSEAEELFGGEWQETEGKYNYVLSEDKENRDEIWVMGKLAVSEIEAALQNNEPNKIFVLSDPTVDTIYDGFDFMGNVPLLPDRNLVPEYMSWLRYWGDVYDAGWCIKKSEFQRFRTDDIFTVK